MVMAVLIGLKTKLELKNHGPQNNKSFSIENQGAKFFVKVAQGDKGLMAVPLERIDAFEVANLYILQLQRLYPALKTAQDVLEMIRAMATTPKQGEQ